MPIGTRSDATKVMMGASLCPADQEVSESVPGSIAAGYAVRRNSSTGAYQVAASGAGPIVGVSKGPTPGRTGYFTVLYSAPKALLRIASVTPTIGAAVRVDDSTGTAAASSNTLTAAIYEKVITGISETDGSSINCAIINMTSGF